MRHNKHRHVLGVKKQHRAALMANLASSLLIHGRIKTTLPKAKALRPFIEKIVTLAKKAKNAENKATAVHYRRQALAKVRNKEAVAILFNEKVEQFMDRNGGYARIYKLGPRLGDAAEMGLIELIAADDEGYEKPKAKKASSKKKKAAEVKSEEPVEVVEENTVAEAKEEETEKEA